MFEILKVPSIRNLLVLAILIRFLIMPFYFHPDIKTYHFQASFLKKGVLNIYDFLSEHKDSLPLKDEFVYFPLTYFFLGAYQIVTTPLLGPNFENWLFNAQINSASDIGIFRYLLILKFPYLILDILIGFLLISFFSEFQVKKKVFTFWMFNPFSIALIYIYSNVDILPVFLIVLSLYFTKKNKFILSSLVLGVGAGFKAFPILLVPYLFLKASNTKEKILVLIFSLGTFFLTIAPFINSVSFKESALISGLTTRIISSGVSLGFGEMLMPAVILLSILFFWAINNKNLDLWRYYLTSFILILISIHFHIHWILWTLPLFAMLYALGQKRDRGLTITFLLMSFSIPILYQDKSMSVALLGAISPLYSLLPMPSVIVARIYDPLIIQGILHSILFGLGLLLSWRILGNRND